MTTMLKAIETVQHFVSDLRHSGVDKQLYIWGNFKKHTVDQNYFNADKVREAKGNSSQTKFNFI